MSLQHHTGVYKDLGPKSSVRPSRNPVWAVPFRVCCINFHPSLIRQQVLGFRDLCFVISSVSIIKDQRTYMVDPELLKK